MASWLVPHCNFGNPLVDLPCLTGKLAKQRASNHFCNSSFVLISYQGFVHIKTCLVAVSSEITTKRADWSTIVIYSHSLAIGMNLVLRVTNRGKLVWNRLLHDSPTECNNTREMTIDAVSKLVFHRGTIILVVIVSHRTYLQK